MFHRLRALGPLPEDPSSIPSIHILPTINCRLQWSLQLQFQGIGHPLLISESYYTHVVHIHTYTGTQHNTHKYIKKYINILSSFRTDLEVENIDLS